MRREGEEPGSDIGGSSGPVREDRDLLDSIDRARRRRAAQLVSILVIVAILVVFIVRNSQRVPIDFVFFERRSRLIWIMLACAVLGGIVGFIAGRPGKQLFGRDRQKGKHEKHG